MSAIASKTKSITWEKIVDFSLENQDELIRIKKDAVTTRVGGILGDIKAFFGARPVWLQRAQTQVSLKSQLRSFLQRQRTEIAGGLSLQPRDKADIKNRIDKIFDDTCKKFGTEITGEAIALAHCAAQHALLTLRNEHALLGGIRILPFEASSTTGKEIRLDNKVCVIQPAPKLANLVLSGGGMKGQAYVAVVKTLENTGIRKDLKHIAGTSAGALTAACIATGMSAQTYADLVTNLDMRDQMNDIKGKPPECRASVDGYAQGGHALRLDSSALRLSAGKLFHTCQSTIRKNVTAFCQGHLSNLSNSNMTREEKASIARLHFRIKQDISYQPTFADLALLHKYDPDNFKELTLTGFNDTDQKLEVFDARSWPDLPVATAMRISMAIPGIIDPVILRENAEDKVMIDGGIGANLPTHLLNTFATGGALKRDKTTEAEAALLSASTMSLTFDANGNAQRALDQGAKGMQMRWYKRLFVAVMAPARLQSFQQDAERFVESGTNGLPVFSGKLDTLSFGASQKMIRAAHVEAEVRFIDALRRNGVADRDRAMHHVYDSIDEAIKSIGKKDLQTFVDQTKDSDPGIEDADARNVQAKEAFITAAENYLKAQVTTRCMEH